MSKSHLTAVRRQGASLPLKALSGLHEINASQTVLDFGCGHGADVAWMRHNGYVANGYDPYWLPDRNVLKEKYDIVLCTYVLNVVDAEERQNIIKRLKAVCKLGGNIYITVRRDIKKNFTTRRGTSQYIVKLNLPVVKENSAYCIYKIAR